MLPTWFKMVSLGFGSSTRGGVSILSPRSQPGIGDLAFVTTYPTFLINADHAKYAELMRILQYFVANICPILLN